ncbi:MAG: HEAT repeat domain-containing protein [Elusimicrobiota bacterium]
MTTLGWSAFFLRVRARYGTLPLAMLCLACAGLVSAAGPDSAADPVKAGRRERRARINDIGRSTRPVSASELIGSLGDEDPYVRGAAAQTLGLRKAQGAWASLSEAAGSEDQHTRWGAVDGLAELGDRRAVPILIGLLSHADKATRWKAAVALGRLGDARAVPGLTAAKNDAYAPVRRAAAEALRRIKR